MARSTLCGKDFWWLLAKPADVTCGDAEWEWYCWRTKRSRELRHAEIEKAKAVQASGAGATAGWRGDMGKGEW